VENLDFPVIPNEVRNLSGLGIQKKEGFLAPLGMSSKETISAACSARMGLIFAGLEQPNS
jgi:hypothetical protein